VSKNQGQAPADLYAERTITAAEWIQARKAIEARLSTNRRLLANQRTLGILSEYVGNGDRLRRQWSSLNLDRQRAIVQTVVHHVVIHPAQRKTNRLDPTRVEPIWRA
jgi:hypothetical protein